MDSGNTVNREAAGCPHMSHVNLVVSDNGNSFAEVVVAGCCNDIVSETAVNFLNQNIDTR